MDVNSMKTSRNSHRNRHGDPYAGARHRLIGAKSVEAIGRNPEAASKVQTMAILAIAFAEAVAIYALVISLIIKFV